MRNYSASVGGILTIFCSMWLNIAHASYSVRPMAFDFAPGDRSHRKFTLVNSGKKNKFLQVELYRIYNKGTKKETKEKKGEMETFYDCTEEIALVIERHYPEICIEDMDRINILVQEELAEVNRKQARENLMDDINGGSR